MTYYLKRGSQFSVTSPDALNLTEELPVGTYTVGQDPMTGVFFLEMVEGFDVSGKIYGDTEKTAERILGTFHARENQTGVMLNGAKGSGKTLLAKLLSVKASEEGIPTIIINNDWHGEEFNRFMQTIEQPTVVIFDEFEKVYGKDEQEQMLTLLDGVYPSKKLFILTCNDKWRVNEHMQNRPGRIFYRIDYTGLDTDFIREYCTDNLKGTEHIDQICRIATLFPEFNFDILKAMVEEMNRYNEGPQDAMKLLNAKPEHGEAVNYEVGLLVKGKKIDGQALETATWRGNPLSGTVQINWYSLNKDGEPDNWQRSKFTVGDIESVDSNTGQFIFVNSKGERLTLSRAKIEVYNMEALMV